MRITHQTSFSLWWIWGALAVALAVHVVIYRVTTSTSYAICLARAKVIGPSTRNITLANAARTLGIRREDCCLLSKDAGEFRLNWKRYIETGAIWVIKPKSTGPQNQAIGFLTNCGEVLSEEEYFDRHLV